MTLKIIAGARRGQKLEGPASRNTRPTCNLVREALFNILADRVDDADVIDLFSGTGALGLEALSRGAATVRFVERDRRALAVVSRNVARLGFEDCTEVIGADVFRWAKAWRPAPDQEPMLILIDPPFREYQAPSRLFAMVRTMIGAAPVGSTLFLETDERVRVDQLPEPDRWDYRKYGSKHLALREVEADDRLPIDDVQDDRDVRSNVDDVTRVQASETEDGDTESMRIDVTADGLDGCEAHGGRNAD